MDESGEMIRVLHVEDDPEFAELTASVLEETENRITVETATAPDEGLDRLAAEQFDCIVSDYNMPGQNGVEFLETVRDEHPRLPFILYTGKGSEEVASEAISAGVTDYLQKTGNMDQYAILANRIENAVSQYHAEAEVERTREYFSTILEHASDYVMVVGEDGAITYVSPAVERVMGYQPERLEGVDAFEFIHPEDESLAGDGFADVLANPEEEHVIEYRARHADGSWRWFEVRGRNLLDDPVVEGVLVNARDVTDKKASRRQLLTVIGNLPGYVYRHRYEPGWPLEFVKGSAQAVTGYTTEELEDEITHAEEVIHPEDREDVWTVSKEELDASGEADVTYRIMTKEGEQRWVRDQSQLVEDPVTGEEVIDGFITDVTEHKRHERELQRYERIVEASGDPVYTVDDDGRFTFVNNRFVEMTGYDWSTLAGSHVSLLMEDDDIEKGESLIRSLLNGTDERATFEMDVVTAEGTRVSCENHIALLMDEGTFHGTVGVVRDITDRKERERELREQNERLDEFVSVVSHDLRNPLNVATSRFELIADECDSDHVEHVERAHDRMESLIEDLLTIARGEDTVTDVEAVDVKALVADVWETVETGSATLVTDVDRPVRAEAGRLKQLFENLFRNAVEHSSTSPDSHTRQDGEAGSASSSRTSSDDAVEHGSPDVTVTVGELEDGFYVEDDGPGIPEDEREQVFEMGYSDSSHGTGFGLSIVDQVVEAHGWTIRVTESAAGGARFEITGVTVAEDR